MKQMKNFNYLVLIAITLLISSCSTPKVVRQSENIMRGTWTLSDIQNDKESTIAVTSLFNKAKLDCFEGSTWNFIENNSTGTYTLDGMGCPSEENKIKWYMEQDGADTYFYFKNLNEGEKAKNIKTGYKMKLVSLTDDQAHFIHELPFEGEKITLNFYFNK